MFGGKELQDEIVGSNSFEVYDFGARNYDAALGRWMNLDPLADHPNQIDKSPYGYAVNNPILYNDPNGKCPPWLCGAIAGGLVEAGSQYIVNLSKGQSWTDAALNIDGADVIASTVEGGASAGASVGRRLLYNATSEVAKAFIDAENKDIINKGLDAVVIETDLSKIVTDVAIGTWANLLGEGVKGTMKAVINSKHTKELTQVEKELKRSMKGTDGEAVRRTKQAELKSTVKGNEVASEATGSVTTEVVDEKLNRKRE